MGDKDLLDGFTVQVIGVITLAVVVAWGIVESGQWLLKAFIQI